MSPNVIAILVTYNRLPSLQKALACVLAQTILPAAVIIVDNNSTDGTVNFLRLIGNDRIHCIYLSSNTGCAGALSAGMTYGLSMEAGEYFWILDDDTYYATTALEQLLAQIKQSGFTMLGVKGSFIRFGKKVPVRDMRRLQKADYVMMDGALIDTAAVHRIGVVNEDFFMMCEDHEYCLRLKKNGFEIGVYQDETEERLCLGGQTGFTKDTQWRGYYSARNHLIILRRYFSLVNLAGYLFFQAKLLVAALLQAPDRWQRIRFRLLGIFHGLKGIRGKTLDPGTMQFHQPVKALTEEKKKQVMQL